ncbi:MAG: L,D-transpeptidase family protein [Steroidobacteraceae bacterium]
MKYLTSTVCTVAFAMGATVSHATIYELGADNQGLFGREERVVTVYEDTLYEIARRFSLGSEEIVRVNPGMDPWLPGSGRDIVIPGERILPPGPREGIVVNLPEHRLYYYPKVAPGEKPYVITYPVSIGKMDWKSPLGKTSIVNKRANPTWTPPESVRREHELAGDPLPRVVPAGPDNPLGEFAMRLGISPGAYLIHGTNNPIAVGMAVTHGCIRMYPEDIKALFPRVPVNTTVWLINEPVKVAWVDGRLLLEAHPPVNAEGQTIEPDVEQFSQLLQKAVGDATVAIHWEIARTELGKARGMPITVGLAADLPDAPAPVGAPAPMPSATAAPVVAPVATPRKTGNGEHLKQGTAAFMRQCSSCHGAGGLGSAGAGNSAREAPRLADHDYDSLRGWLGARASSKDVLHQTLLMGLRDAEVAGLADYVSRLAPAVDCNCKR